VGIAGTLVLLYGLIGLARGSSALDAAYSALAGRIGQGHGGARRGASRASGSKGGRKSANARQSTKGEALTKPLTKAPARRTAPTSQRAPVRGSGKHQRVALQDESEDDDEQEGGGARC
jgi:hypothetical protein